MMASVDIEKGAEKECKSETFGKFCRVLGVGCEICAGAVIVGAVFMVIIWALMYFLN